MIEKPASVEGRPEAATAGVLKSQGCKRCSDPSLLAWPAGTAVRGQQGKRLKCPGLLQQNSLHTMVILSVCPAAARGMFEAGGWLGDLVEPVDNAQVRKPGLRLSLHHNYSSCASAQEVPVHVGSGQQQEQNAQSQPGGAAKPQQPSAADVAAAWSAHKADDGKVGCALACWTQVWQATHARMHACWTTRLAVLVQNCLAEHIALPLLHSCTDSEAQLVCLPCTSATTTLCTCSRDRPAPSSAGLAASASLWPRLSHAVG